MKQSNSDPSYWKNWVGIYCLLLVSVFATELSIMQLFAPLFARIGTVAAGLIDATTITTLGAVPLWLLLRRLIPEDEPRPLPWSERPSVLLAKTLAGLFLIQFAIMLLLPELLPGASPVVCDMIDAVQTALIFALPLWRTLFNERMRRRCVPLMDTPLRMYVLLLSTIFLADLLQELFLTSHGIDNYFGPGKIIDAFFTTICCAPLLWLLVARPLKLAARSEKERAHAVYAQVIEAVVVVDRKGVVVSFNPAAERIFGFSAAEMVGEPAARLFKGGAPEFESLATSTRGPRADGEPIPIRELNCLRRDGLTLIMTVSISRLFLNQEAEFLLIMRDITKHKTMEQALKESETRFRQIFQQSEEAIVFFKPGSLVVLDANENAERVFGYSKQELLEGVLPDCCSPGDLPDLKRAIASVSETERAHLEFLCRRGDGAEIIVSLRGRRMLLQGVPVTYCTFRDITERVRLEENAREIQSRLIQANKMTSLGLLVSGVAHEINNPNNFIMANCELLSTIFEDMLKALKEYGPDEGEGIYLGGIALPRVGDQAGRLIDGIANGSRRVNEIVNNLKGFARQQPEEQRGEVDVNQVARSAVSLLQHELMRYTDHFHLELAEHLPPVSGHGQHLGQVIINLVMNACQALPDRESGIWLGTGFDPDSEQVVITVRDQGVGMTTEASRRVLEPFFTTKLDSGGTGLGLSISESIVKQHGGTLEFTSREREGTTFFVKLPPAHLTDKEQSQ